MTVSTRSWSEMTGPELGALDPEQTVAVLPVAATEQHGPHLPVGVDAMINRAILQAALERAGADLPVVLLPPQEVGWSDEHGAFPGTLSIDATTLVRGWTALGEGVRRCGLRRLVIFNSHGGQPELVTQVARDLRVRLGMLVVCANWFRLGLPPLPWPEEELRHGIHAGAVETSLMLHIRPELVRLDRIDDFPSQSAALARHNRMVNPLGPTPFAWMTQDLNESGACGDARLASAELGARILDHAAGQFVTLLRETAALPLSVLRTERPGG